jgi:hypothetical protein
MINMTFQKTLIGCFVFAIVGFLGMPCAQADPLHFSNTVALQNNGTRVNLFSNAGVTLTGPQVSFLVDITGTLVPGETHSLLITYAELGSSPVSQSFLIPAFGSIPPPFSQLFTFTSTNTSFSGTMASLTIDIQGVNPDFVIPGGPNAGQLVDSYTYHFNVAKPIPEPGTLVMMAMGIAGILGNVRRRRGNRS